MTAAPSGDADALPVSETELGIESGNTSQSCEPVSGARTSTGIWGRTHPGPGRAGRGLSDATLHTERAARPGGRPRLRPRPDPLDRRHRGRVRPLLPDLKRRGLAGSSSCTTRPWAIRRVQLRSVRRQTPGAPAGDDARPRSDLDEGLHRDLSTHRVDDRTMLDTPARDLPQLIAVRARGMDGDAHADAQRTDRR